jgi:hypothetical protein
VKRLTTPMLLLVLATAPACRGRAPTPRAKDATVSVPAASPVDASVPQPRDPAWPFGPTSLARSSGNGVFLVEERGAILMRDVSGASVRTLVASDATRANYDPRIGVVWFLRAERLEAIDLADTGGPIAIVDEMPDLSFRAGRGTNVARPMCDACVTVSAVPPAVGITAEANASGGELQGDASVQFERDRKIALVAHPRLAATAASFLARLGRRTEVVSPTIELGERMWPLPRGARSQVRCTSGCGRAFALQELGWQLVVVGRACDCLDDRCWGTCVFYDPARKQYAQPSKPENFRSTAIAERACHITLDTTRTAYLLDDHDVCTAAGCITVTGKILGWVEPGVFTGVVPEDISACPEGP